MRELTLAEISPDGALRADFLALHAPWTERGLTRWLSLLESGSRRPVVVVGAFVDATLIGAVIGVWDRAPCDRFDDLIERTPDLEPTQRPTDGAWHLIAVTTSERAEVRNLGLARALLGCILATLRATGHGHVRTLSPALGLPALAATWPGSADDAVLHAARNDGRPALQVMRLHLGGGAMLERVLHQSRRDDSASGAINLRFCYATDPEERAVQKGRWQRWVAARGRALVLVGRLDDEPLYRAPALQDALVWSGPSG